MFPSDLPSLTFCVTFLKLYNKNDGDESYNDDDDDDDDDDDNNNKHQFASTY
jgi:hypothetical protein